MIWLRPTQSDEMYENLAMFGEKRAKVWRIQPPVLYREGGGTKLGFEQKRESTKPRKQKLCEKVKVSRRPRPWPIYSKPHYFLVYKKLSSQRIIIEERFSRLNPVDAERNHEFNLSNLLLNRVSIYRSYSLLYSIREDRERKSFETYLSSQII